MVQADYIQQPQERYNVSYSYIRSVAAEVHTVDPKVFYILIPYVFDIYIRCLHPRSKVHHLHQTVSGDFYKRDIPRERKEITLQDAVSRYV